MIEKNPGLIIRLWHTAIIIFFITVSLIGMERGLASKEAAAKRHSQRIDPVKNEKGKTKANWDQQLLDASRPSEVLSGIYVDRIIELSLPDAYWVVDFYIWFHWKDKKISPGKTFQIVDGEIVKSEQVKKSKNNGQYYELYRVKAKMTKFFNPERFPRDDHLLTINIEDRKNQIYTQQYKPDREGSAVSSRVKLQGYKVYKTRLEQKFHSYKTRRGELANKNDAQDTFSKLTYGIWIKRPGWGGYIKMFEGLFAAVAVVMLTFFISTTTTNRISLGVGAFFASVAATYVATRNLPNVGVLTLTDVVTGLAMLTVFLVLWHTIIATRLFEMHQDKEMVRRFNIHGFLIFVTGFVVANASLAFFASI